MSPLSLLGFGVTPQEVKEIKPPVVPATPQRLDGPPPMPIEGQAGIMIQDPPPAPAELTGDQFFKNHVLECKKESETARNPHKAKWDICWDLFNHNYDFSKKADWQSKSWVPKIPTLVRATSALIKQALLSQEEFGTIEGRGDQSKAKAPMMKRLVMWAMDEGKFIEKFVEALMAGMLTPGVNLKIYPKCVKADTSTGSNAGPANLGMTNFKNIICYESVDEYNILRDPTGSNKYKIHVIEMDLADLKALASDPANGYDQAVVNSIQAHFDSQEADYNKAVRNGQNSSTVPKPPYRKRVKICEYWGVIYAEDGTVKFPNGTMSVANENFLIRKPMANPYRHGKDPIITGFPSKVPFSTWHEAYVYAVTAIARMINEVMNLTLDGYFADSIKAYEVDIDQLVDPEELANGIYPGKGIKKTGLDTPHNRPLITPVDMGHMKPEQQIVYGGLVNEFQNGSGTSEFSIPQLAVTDRREVTATEVNDKSAASQLFTNDLAQTLEREVIEPAIQMTAELIIQYFNDFSNPAIQDMLGEDAVILSMARTNEERMALLGGNYYSKSRALTGIVRKTEKIEKIRLVMGEMKNFPAVLALIDPLRSVKNIFELVDLDPKEWLAIDPNAQPAQPEMKPPSPLAPILFEHRMKQGQIPYIPGSSGPAMMPANQSLGGLMQ